MPGLEAVIDVIYNPDKTELILRAEELGVPVADVYKRPVKPTPSI